MPNLSANTKAHISLLIVNLIYGANYTIAKGIMPDIVKPSGFIMIRVIGAAALFWSVYLAFKQMPARGDLYKFAIAGLFGVACNQLLFFNGLNETSGINAAIIMTVTPVLVLLISVIIGMEKINATKITGLALGLVGSIMLIRSSAVDSSSVTSLRGDLMILGNAISYGIYLVYVKPLMKKYKPITVITWVFSFGLLFVLPFGWEQMREVNWSELDSVALSSIFYVVLCTTFFAYLLNIFALKTLNPSVASIYIYLQPVMALFFSFVFFWLGTYGNNKPEITWVKVLCAILIFTGVYLVSKRKRA